jgi:molybdate-binding protein
VVHSAPTHLLDEETGKYNTPFIDKFGLAGKAIVVRGYNRRIGLIIGKGNPKNIKSLKDLLRPDIIMVNRTKGSGTRVYLDIMLKKIAREENIDYNELIGRIKGYTYEVKSHTAVAAAVAQGRADVGLGAEIAARVYGLDFIPLTWEEYDFAVLKDRLERPLVKKFIESLRDPRLQSMVNSIPGYRIGGDAGTIKQ